jgi:hypothetical protein
LGCSSARQTNALELATPVCRLRGAKLFAGWL